jgi:hypothetical protein
MGEKGKISKLRVHMLIHVRFPFAKALSVTHWRCMLELESYA